MSEESNKIKFFMIKGLSNLSHFYKETVEGSYEAAINNYGFKVPVESKETIVQEVTDILKKILK